VHIIKVIQRSRYIVISEKLLVSSIHDCFDVSASVPYSAIMSVTKSPKLNFIPRVVGYIFVELPFRVLMHVHPSTKKAKNRGNCNA
jgi:hypothetical protein